MPIEHALWRIGEKPVQLETATLGSEADLEEMIAQDMSILSNQ
jgi:hypothetical protein